MATKLTDSNIDKILKEIPKKGFRTKFWREYRAGACKGSGVGKIMDQLEKYGVPPSGDPSKADLDEMPNIVQAFSMLSNAMLKANGKCGALQKHSSLLCKEYRKIISKLEDKATKLAQNAGKIKAQKLLDEQRIQQQNEATDKHLEKLKKEHEANRKLFVKQIKEVETRAAKIEEACKKVSKDVAEAQKLLEAVKKDWKSKHGKEGADRPKIEATADKQIRAVAAKFKISAHAKSISGPLPKLVKDVTSNFTQFKQEDWNKKELVAAGKKVAAARRTYEQARDAVKFYTAQHKIALNELQKARPEGV